MPKKGEKLLYRVQFTYPPSERAPEGIKGTKSFHNRETADLFAREVAGRGATAWLFYRPLANSLQTYQPNVEAEGSG